MWFVCNRSKDNYLLGQDLHKVEIPLYLFDLHNDMRKLLYEYYSKSIYNCNTYNCYNLYSFIFLKRKNTREFVTFIMPYVIFFSFAAIVFYINIYIKPKWVLIEDNTTANTIDRGKLLFYSALPIILFGLMEIFYLRYKKSHSTPKTMKNTQ